MKLFVIFIVFLSMLFSAGCAAGEVKNTSASQTADETNETEEETEAILKSSLPEGLDYNGAEFNMLSNDYVRYFADELNGDVLNDAQYNVRKKTEELLDIVVNENITDIFQMVSECTKLVNSGDTTYDTVQTIDRFAVAMMLEKLLLPIEKMEYVDLDAVYWCPVSTDALSIKGHKYLAVSSCCLQVYKSIGVIIVNSSLADNYNIVDLYNTVYDGKWTYDKLKENASVTGGDLNGDGSLDKNDSYGLYSPNMRIIMGDAWVACGEKIMTKNSEDIPEYRAAGNEKFMSICEKAYSLYNDNDFVYHAEELPSIDMFKNDQVLFAEVLTSYCSLLRDMESDYMILPLPKYDEAQPVYYSRSLEPYIQLVLTNCEDTSFTGAVLEAISYEGYKNIVPAYVEATLSYKYQRDDESVDMLNRILGNIMVDVGEVYLSTWFDVGRMYDRISASSFDMASWLSKNETAIYKRIDEIMEIITDT